MPALSPSPERPTAFARVLAWLPFVASAGLTALAIHMAIERPFVGLVLVEVALALFLPQILTRRKHRRLLRSGNVEAVLSAWQPAVEKMPHAETMAPLITATALAAHGMADRARAALRRAHRGAVWEAAIEQRLVLETLLSVFDGETDRAVANAAALSSLPLPTSPFLRGRVTALRAAMSAFARAFAHRSESSDIETLMGAAKQHPLVHWAMRYAAAVVSIDRGSPDAAARLIGGAPVWPAESVFAAFHAELAERAAGGVGPRATIA